MDLSGGYDHAFALAVAGVALVAGGLWVSSFYQPALFGGVFIVAGIAIGGSYIGAGGADIASRAVDTGSPPLVAAVSGLLVAIGGVEVAIELASGDRIWLFVGLVVLNAQVVLGAVIAEAEQPAAFVMEAVTLFVSSSAYLSANTRSANLAGFLTVGALTALLFAVFGWPLYRLGTRVGHRTAHPTA